MILKSDSNLSPIWKLFQIQIQMSLASIWNFFKFKFESNLRSNFSSNFSKFDPTFFQFLQLFFDLIIKNIFAIHFCVNFLQKVGVRGHVSAIDFSWILSNFLRFFFNAPPGRTCAVRALRPSEQAQKCNRSLLSCGTGPFLKARKIAKFRKLKKWIWDICFFGGA